MASIMRKVTCTLNFACMGAPVTSLDGYPLKRKSMIAEIVFMSEQKCDPYFQTFTMIEKAYKLEIRAQPKKGSSCPQELNYA